MVWNMQRARNAGLVVMLCMVMSGCVTPQQAAPSETSSAATPSRWLDRTATEQAAAILAGEVSSEMLVRGYLRRIETQDLKVNSILTLNPDALAQARARDQALANGEVRGPLHGLPVLLKDNIEATGMATTAGSMALASNDTGRDAPVVARLKAAGAIILGKTNLSEWANFRSESSISGWSAVGGLTRNPHLLNRSACGSSSGSGAAMAIRLASLAVGTETNGSIICPAAMNGIVGFKPSVGLVSRRHIVPISHTQDTAGPMTRSVLDAAVMLQAMAGADADDPATQQAPTYLPPADTVTQGSLKGLRVGVVRFRQGDNPHVLSAYNAALDTLKRQGAVLVELNDFSQPEGFWPSSYKVLLSEFHHNINDYLAGSPAPIPARDLNGLMEFNKQTPRELALFDQSIFAKSLAAPALDSDEYQEALTLVRTTARDNGIDQFLTTHKLDVIVAPSNSPAFMIDAIYGDHSPVGFIGIGYLAAVAGYPHLTVPVAEVKGLPVGLSFIGGQWQDMQVLRAGYLFEQQHAFTPNVQMAESRMQEPELKGLFQPLSVSDR